MADWGARRSEAARRWLLPVLAMVFLMLPGHPAAQLDGLPLRAWELGALLGLVIALYGLGMPGRVPASQWLALAVVLLIGLKLLLWWVAPNYGLAASYYSRDRVGGNPEPSTEALGASYTRMEEGPGRPALATHFFNDVERFNFYQENEPSRANLPFAVRWDGFLSVPHDGDYAFELDASGPALLALDARPVLTVPAYGGADRVNLALTAGAHPLGVEYVRLEGRTPVIRLEWDLGRGEAMRPLGAPYLTASPSSQDQVEQQQWSALVAIALDAGFLAWLTAFAGVLGAARMRAIRSGTLGLERFALSIFLAAITTHAMATTTDLYGRATILEGGQDWLTYESYARDILLNGPLMTLGKPLGEGKPFFFQPFYPYYLAGLHWLTGEDLWGPIVLQLVGLGVCGVILYWLARRLFGVQAAIATLALFAILRATQLDWVARKLLSENLYFVVLPMAIFLLIRTLDEGRRSDLVLAGLLLGVASITRAPTLLYLPAVAGILAAGALRGGDSRRSALAAGAVVVLVAFAVAALVPLRNYVVSGRAALVATNGGATLLLAHPPTPKVRLARVDENPLYNAMKLDRQTREVLEFVRQDPPGYVATLIPLALYSVGFSGAIDGSAEVAPDILLLTALYLGSLALLPSARSLRVSLLHVFIGIHLVIMVTFLPYVYGYRQVLPMHLLMLVFGGGMIALAVRRIAATHRNRVAHGPLMEQGSP